MISLGELLKTKRAEKGLSISQVSDLIKIPQKLLKALEQGQYEVFASDVYLKGFLRNYSKFLGVDINRALAIYRRECSRKDDQGVIDIKSPMKEPKPIITPGRLVVALIVVVVLAVGGFISYQLNVIMKPPELSLTEPVETVAPAEVLHSVDTDSITIMGEVEVGSKLMVNGNEVTTNNLQEFRLDNYKLKEGSNEIYIVAESYYFSKSSEIKLVVTYTDASEQEEIAESEAQDTQQVDSMNVVLEIEDEPAWVVLTIDTITKLSDVLQPRESYNFEALDSVTIFTPRPQVVTFSINGKEYQISSQREAVFKLKNGEIIRE